MPPPETKAAASHEPPEPRDHEEIRAAGRNPLAVEAGGQHLALVNGAVLVPTFRQPKRDAEACAVLTACFPGREIVPVDCRELIWGLGAIHCLTQQQPA